MILYVDRIKTENFISKVFNYYNGRINTCNLARLEINWANLPEITNAAISRNPNVVIMNPCVIARFSEDEFMYYYFILITIIHELYHQDQIIDYIRMASDPEYVRLIESVVEIETNIYLANHMNEVLYEFGLDISRFSFDIFRDNIAMFEFGYHYKRRTWFDHILISLREIITYYDIFEQIRDTLIKAYESGGDTFKLTINNSSIFIVLNGAWINIQDLNNFLYENFYKYYARMTTVTYSNNHLEISSTLRNIMCF